MIKRCGPHGQRGHSPNLNLTGQVLGQRPIGGRIARRIASLRTTVRVPSRRIHAALPTIHQRHCGSGELVEQLHQVRRPLQATVGCTPNLNSYWPF